MIVTVDRSSGVPPYEQLRSQIATMIQSEVLPPGTQLPPIRQLAADLALAGNTVARAYRELETEGLVVLSGRHGTVVADGMATLDAPQRRAKLERAAHAFAHAARTLGISAPDALSAARDALATSGPEPTP